VSTAAYNLRGFRTQWTDADQAGSWTLTGNSLNELVSWTDPKSSSFSATYDKLGRMTSRTQPEFTANWTWGNSATKHNIGRLELVSGPVVSESRLYDSLGRLKTRVINTDDTYQYDYSYNTIGALDTLTYPTSPVPAGQTGSRFKIKYTYDHGVPSRIQDVTQSATTLWTLTEETPSSLPKKETLGASLIAVENGYTPWTDELTSVKAGTGGSSTNRQNLSYTWNDVGFLTQRQDLNQNLTEIFTPDPLDRVTAATLNGTPTLSVDYDESGNIESKDGATYVYGSASRPHRVTAAGTDTFSYDANGNMTSRNGLTQVWTSDNFPLTLRGPTYESTFTYGPERQRWRQVATYSNGTETTHYVGGLLEKMQATSTGLTYWRHYVPTPSGLTILVSRNSNNTSTKTYLLSDHLGSSDAVLDESGNTLVRESFDAFGARRGGNWSASTAPNWTAIGNTSRRGFTFHEMADNVNLVHMNGRVYDPKLGRFISIDPLIAKLADSQLVNPYAYVGNRPLSFVDPSGLFPQGPLPCDWTCNVVAGAIATALNFAFGGSSRPPPPATALPGISAQNGVGICVIGNSASSCGGTVLYPATPKFNPIGFGGTPHTVEGAPSATPQPPCIGTPQQCGSYNWLRDTWWGQIISVTLGNPIARLNEGVNPFSGLHVPRRDQEDALILTVAAPALAAAPAANGLLQSGRSIVESVAREQASIGYTRLVAQLTPRQRAACARDPRLCRAFVGTLVHELTRDALQSMYGSRFRYQRRGIDFIDTLTGERVELGTAAQYAEKLGKYPNDVVATYPSP
jgi:RHS repeat-associated protein